MSLLDPPDAAVLSDADYADEVAGLLVAIRDAADLEYAVECVEQRLAIVLDRRFLGEFLHYLSAAPRERMTIVMLSLPIEQVLANTATELLSPAGLALAFFFADDAHQEAFPARVGHDLDPAFYTALEEIAATAERRPDVDNDLVRGLLTTWRRRGRQLLQGWAASMLLEPLKLLLQVPAGQFLSAIVGQARRSLGSNLTRLPAVQTFFRMGDDEDELAVAFCAWAVERAVQVTNELPQAPGPVLVDILRMDADRLLDDWLTQAMQEARGEAATMCLRLLSWLVALPDPATAPPPLLVLARVGQVTSAAAVHELVREEPWLLIAPFLLGEEEEDDRHIRVLLLDPAADLARLRLTVDEVRRLRADLARPEGNPIVAAARAVHSGSQIAEAAAARLLANSPPDELYVIGAAFAVTRAYDDDIPFARTLAELNARLAPAYADRPIVQVVLALSLAEATMNEREAAGVLPLAERAVALARPTRHAMALPAALHVLGQSRAAAGDLAGAVEALNEAFNVALVIPPPYGRDSLLLELADIAVAGRDYEGLAYYLDLVEHYGLADEESTSAGRYWALRGQLFWTLDIGTEAAQAWARAATIASRLGDVALLNLLATQAVQEQRADEALSLLDEILKATEHAGDLVKAAQIATKKLAILLDLPPGYADLAPAYDQFDRLVTAAGLEQNPFWGSTITLVRDGYLRRSGAPDAAGDALAQAIARASPARSLADWSYLLLAQVDNAAGRGDFAAAHALLEQVRAHVAELPTQLQVSLNFEEGLVKAREAVALANSGRSAEAATLRAATAAAWRVLAEDPHAGRDVRLSVLDNLTLLYRQMADHAGLRWAIHTHAALLDEHDPA